MRSFFLLLFFAFSVAVGVSLLRDGADWKVMVTGWNIGWTFTALAATERS
jgi:hypothetical protein